MIKGTFRELFNLLRFCIKLHWFVIVFFQHIIERRMNNLSNFIMRSMTKVFQ